MHYLDFTSERTLLITTTMENIKHRRMRQATLVEDALSSYPPSVVSYPLQHEHALEEPVWYQFQAV